MQTSKNTLLKRLAWVTAGGMLLGGPILWPNLASGFAQATRQVAPTSSSPATQRVTNKSEVQRQLDALYARDGKRAPQMQLQSNLDATNPQDSRIGRGVRDTQFESPEAGFVTPVASSEGEETSVFGKILAKFRRNPAAPTSPPEEPNPYHPGAYSSNSTPVGQGGQNLPVQPTAMPQFKQMLANPIPPNGQAARESQGEQNQPQSIAAQQDTSRRRQRHPAVQHGAISAQPSQQPVFVFEESTSDRQGARAAGPADADLNTGWDAIPARASAAQNTSQQPQGRQQPANQVPWDGLTEPADAALTAESADFFPDDAAQSRSRMTPRTADPATAGGQPSTIDPRLDLSTDLDKPAVEDPLSDELGGLSPIGAGPGSAGGPRRPTSDPMTEVSSPESVGPKTSTPKPNIDAIDADPDELGGAAVETFEDPFTGLTLESRPTTTPSVRSRSLPMPGDVVPTPPPLHDSVHPLTSEPSDPLNVVAPTPPASDSSARPLVPSPGLGGGNSPQAIPDREFPSTPLDPFPELEPFEPSAPIDSSAEFPPTVGPSDNLPSAELPEGEEEQSGNARLPLLIPDPVAPSSLNTPENARQIAPEVSHSQGDVQSKLERIAARKGKVGLKGFCPVALRDERDLKDAVPSFSTVIEGKRYYVSSAAALAQLETEPEKYTPATGGNDVVHYQLTGQEVEGSLDHASWFQGRLYLFVSAETMENFVAAPSSHAVR